MKPLKEISRKIHRLIYIVSALLMVLLGLSSRRFSNHLPTFIAENSGDMLWVMMVYFGFRFLLIRKSLLFAGIMSLLFSFGIECSQLYQADWINDLRNTTIGALILGRGFLLIDLIRYLLGILLAGLLDKFLLLKKHGNSIREH
ncbi:DUF2809 domain-containing protein [Cytobacillus oceanisediminis]|uniref:DUF2809 domain-containing protein n=1 Tax=Niallia alba TaxID=2729105 RepID=A0A7Y0K5Z4_9BACI|nr:MULTISPECIES: DUF2809 domain-containing protein [Bacillaceae]EOR24625.1 hypothetical protein A499_07680 [Niallia nealsonii AAU1]MBQ6446776.1 DUF2809 domain-containing protein [Bacillus sp. (in: firmicutes)]MBZ9534259.1 DUF2809 domain-containing protein [Cytobacillus oceanisediminis]NMO76123.1 DUF2809 domain-containing protein [Niallia alba]UTI44558.1 DUF2809 domain-containing protein [Niallia sp. RD1]